MWFITSFLNGICYMVDHARKQTLLSHFFMTKVVVFLNELDLFSFNHLIFPIKSKG